ncbi:UDP-N-acetylglucosamine--N-acetylmuramyl-(pentapeptide) pyrophosphoryl-undecaprenol N-acetylglucosamine transferase [Streptococcus sp. DD13]|uniref:UDP-N-acetylglucosamine--N-acetylmuramyl- (pentapeptide) pyrophosphoryl-undecaprenol N-acetylglucosamine transferase n=1 Tax=Streptococcus sp. DD13 TaxID=1777881 RepID=UPI0007951762|nr:UDP-N-acetylglucosamine--N-acetylmuramyl-(pentapeptide) pyrophosphoryl-undecaprenol N-acetylglucosamine transferase [Streptococcus sp. DD13]KXT79285.1 transferase [Streptococcus sp. DD13]
MSKKTKKKIVFTGGGTVGHVTLNLLLIPRFIEEGWEVHYIGDKKGIEYKELTRTGLPIRFHGIATGKLRRYFSWQNLLDLFKVGFGTLQSLAILLRNRPQILFSKGGFVSVPPVVAARCLGIPVYIHESDLSMGLANRIAYKFATKMYTTFEQPKGLVKAQHVGAITKVKADEKETHHVPQEVLDVFDKELPTVLFVGGSAGAKVFNDFVTNHKEILSQHFNIINLSGNESLNELSPRLYRVDYVTDLYQPLMNLADVVVTRGGSNTIFELVALQKLHLIVPLGTNASRGDQIENAQYFEERHYAKQLAEDKLTYERFVKEVKSLLDEKDSYQESMKHSTEIQTPDDFYAQLLSDIAGKEVGNGSRT